MKSLMASIQIIRLSSFFILMSFTCVALQAQVTNEKISPRISKSNVLHYKYKLLEGGIANPIHGNACPTLQQGYFCKLEHKRDKASNVAYRFRLGTLDYVNRLELKY